MDKNILKKFAIESRQELIDKISNKIKMYFIDEEFEEIQNGEVYSLVNERRTLTYNRSEYQNRKLLIKRIKEIGLNQVIEEASYTWFNRIIAIRYMEIHDFLPLTKDNQSLGIRVLSSKNNEPIPEIMKFSNLNNSEIDINLNKEYYLSLNDDNDKFKYILLLICKKIGRIIPQVFDGITDYIDILIPDNLLNESGYITKLLREVSEENFNEVEIIGWLYQYYNQMEKDRVISAKKAYKKNEIPFATQLFTPDWIVKYMVENSLGRYWIEHNGESDIINNWKYFIKDSIDTNNRALSVKEISKMKVSELNRLAVNKIVPLDPKTITFIDPCSGSGHILVYAFEVLYQIYLSAGYNKKDIPEMILKYNLYGLDIDDRAGQLSILSVILKAREYDKNIFNKKVIQTLNIMSIQESNVINKESLDILKSNDEDLEGLTLNDTIDYVYDTFLDAKEIGSLLIVKDKDYDNILNRIDEITKEQIDLFDIDKIIMLNEKFAPLLKIAKMLSKKFDIVVTNPPYLNSSLMDVLLKNYVSKNYKNTKTDMCTAFMEIKLLKNDGYLGMINQHSWMFLSSYENLRKNIIENYSIENMIHLGTRAFEGIGGEVVQTTSFILKNKNKCNKETIFVRLVNFDRAELKEEEFLKFKSNRSENYYKINIKKFESIPGIVLGYWLSDNMIDIYDKGERLKDIAAPRKGNSTSDNFRFLRIWSEVNINKINFNVCEFNIEDTHIRRWFPYNKGGGYRKWFGNNTFLIDWKDDAKEIRNIPTAVIANYKYFLKPGLTWSTVTTENFSVRDFGNGYIFDNGGCCIFELEENKHYINGLLNSIVFKKVFGELSPTLNFQSGEIAKFPVIINNYYKEDINKLVEACIYISKEDWDSFETSWDFKTHPLVKYNLAGTKSIWGDIKKEDGKSLEKAFSMWKITTNTIFEALKYNEEELNKIFIDIYGLQDELTPEVKDEDITIRKADKIRDIKSLISYAVGCMFGRYSLDKEGLIFAGGDFNSIYEKCKGQKLVDENGQALEENLGRYAGMSLSNYKYLKDGEKEVELTFYPDRDNIIPITDEAYFDDDIVARFVKFIEIVYGKETLNENIKFIAETLGKKNNETDEETIRRYFINDFYNDHMKIYQKKPIYWLFDSGKKNGFKCLIYMHRYDEQIVAKIRLDYFHRMQNTYEKELESIEYKLREELSPKEKKELLKRQANLNAKLQETNEYDEKISHIANQRIKIDLDDGVTVNYSKFVYKNPKTGKEESILGRIK